MAVKSPLDVDKTLSDFGNLEVGGESAAEYDNLLARIRKSRIEKEHDLLCQAVEVALNTLGFAPNEDLISDRDHTISYIKAEKKRCGG